MINADKVHLWKSDVADSVHLYNNWFFEAAPAAYRSTRAATIAQVQSAMEGTNFLRSLSAETLRKNPEIISALRMMTAPPLARDRLIGLGYLANTTLIKTMETGRLPARMIPATLNQELGKICTTILRLADRDLLCWLDSTEEPSESDVHVAATVVADRLCGAIADPIVRNAQERRQLAVIDEVLQEKGYQKAAHPKSLPLRSMPLGTYSFRQDVVVSTSNNPVNIPVDVVIQPHAGHPSGYPILIECKSAGDFTNTNKRRKEEAQKFTQLKAEFSTEIPFILFLNGYFGPGYLGYSAAEGIDWIWEHRTSDMEKLGL